MNGEAENVYKIITFSKNEGDNDFYMVLSKLETPYHCFKILYLPERLIPFERKTQQGISNSFCESIKWTENFDFANTNEKIKDRFK